MQYHIIAVIILIIYLIIFPSIPFLVYLSVFRKKLKQSKPKLSAVLIIVFLVIAVMPVSVFGISLVKSHFESNKAYADMLLIKEELVQYARDNADDFRKIAEYESSFEYPDCVYYFLPGHSEKELQNKLNIKLKYPFIIMLGINSDTKKVDFVQWHYYTDKYDIIFVYPIDNFSPGESYEIVCDNIYVGHFKKDH